MKKKIEENKELDKDKLQIYNPIIQKQTIINENGKGNIIKEDNIKYNYEILTKEKENFNKEIFCSDKREVEFKIMIKNNYNQQWPSNGRTKFIIDKNSDLKANDIILNNLKEKQYYLLQIKIDLNELKIGKYKCIYNFIVDGKIYGNPLILTISIKEEEKEVQNFRKEFCLSINDYSHQRLLKVLTDAKYDFAKAFDSLFQ